MSGSSDYGVSVRIRIRAKNDASTAWEAVLTAIGIDDQVTKTETVELDACIRSQVPAALFGAIISFLGGAYVPRLADLARFGDGQIDGEARLSPLSAIDPEI